MRSRHPIISHPSTALTRRLAYEAYLSTSTWRDKRSQVLQRCRHVCEGCGNRRATEIHHLWYPDNEMPGSPIWIAVEKLYHLVALCDHCHNDVHHVWEPAKRPKDAQNDATTRFGRPDDAIHQTRA